jgi:broad specificity phosphatase PhoE
MRSEHDPARHPRRVTGGTHRSGKKLEFILVRHGATDWNIQGRCQGSTDRELSEAGVRQAEAVAASLSRRKIGAVYSSGLLRARRTAHLISRPHGLAVQIEHDVRELDHGALEGLTFTEIKEQYPDFIQKWRTEPAELQVPGGERLTDVQRRAWAGLNRIAARHDENDTLVVVSHNFPILGIICHVTGTHLNNYRDFRVEPCGHTRLQRDASTWRITHINDKIYPDKPPAC